MLSFITEQPKPLSANPKNASVCSSYLIFKKLYEVCFLVMCIQCVHITLPKHYFCLMHITFLVRLLQFETNNSVDIFASNACKTSLLRHIGLLMKSKTRDMTFL